MSLENSLVLGRYRVLWQVDQKKLIKTYIGRDERQDGSSSPVLIKHYMHDLGDPDSPSVTALFDELAGLTRLRHSGVVPLLGYGTVEHCLITAYAHLPGIDLPALCEHFTRKQKAFPEHLAVFIVRRLLNTLSQCHTREGGSFVHGRITLGCIHLPTSGEPQISDFGLAALEDVAAEAESQLGFFQTRMSYAAPELTRGGPPTPHGDTYSLALLLYRLLTGSNPFRGRSIPETLQRVLQLPPAELHMPHWHHASAANTILMRALSKDPGVRHQSCQELADALAPIQDGTEATLADELSALVRTNAAADVSQVARFSRSMRKSVPPRISSRTGTTQTHAAADESKAPAFVSGLLTEQPKSVTEHTMRDRVARQKRARQRQLAVLPTVLIPAAAIIFGLFLGRLGGAGVSQPAARTSAQEPASLVNGSVPELRARLRSCFTEDKEPSKDAKVELAFGQPGELAQVRLTPPALAQTRIGACLLERAWASKLTAPGAMSVLIPLVESK
jgi:serine/threonine protein kinase